MEKGKIVIIDDDVSFANRLKNELLHYYNEEIIMLNFFDWEFINNNNIDLMFLDIELGEFEDENEEERREVNGIEEAIKVRNLKRWDIEIIFITSHSSFITSSFDAGPLYFIDKKELDEKLPRAVRALERKGFRKKNIQRICGQIIYIDEVVYVESEKHYVYFRLRNPKDDIKLRMTMDEVAKLNIDVFIRIHRSYIVNMVFIKKKYMDKIILFDDTRLPVGRKYQETFNKRYVFEKLKEII